MPPKVPKDVPGSFPDNSRTVLVLVDVINALEFEGGDKFKRSFRAMSKNLQKLVQRARAASIPVIYVNDNFGKWRSDFKTQIAHCIGPDSPNRDNVLRLLPEESDYYVLKPKHSAFYACPFNLLLRSIQAENVIFTGISAESCILFTATDAYLREYKVILAKDCLASESAAKMRNALQIMRLSLKAEIMLGHDISFKDLNRKQKKTSAKSR